MLIKKDKKDRFKPDKNSILFKYPEILIYIGSGEVDYYIRKSNFDIIYYEKDDSFYYVINEFNKPANSIHKEAIELRNKLKLLT